MAKRAAHYDIVFHGGFVLDAGSPNRDKALEWKMPDGFVYGTNRAKPMLAFMLVPLSGDVRFEAFVNHRQVLDWGPISQRTVHGLWSPFSARTAIPEGTSFNPQALPVRILIKTGKARFENVVMWSWVDLD
jgi:hypothetical protein